MGERTQDSIQALTAEIEQLRRSNQWFKEVLDAIKEGIEVVSQDGTVIYVNAGFHRILDESKDERLGKNIYDVSPNGALVETLRTGKPSIARLHTTLNQTKTVLANAMPLVDEQGKPAGAISVFMDISDVERTGRLLEKRNLEINRLRERVQQLASSDYCFDDIIGSSDLLNQCKKVAGKIANTKMTVLLSGESGTGKELFAHSIHGASRRSRGPFIKVNCAAIPAELLESELFGYEYGAFTTLPDLLRHLVLPAGVVCVSSLGELVKQTRGACLEALGQDYILTAQAKGLTEGAVMARHALRGALVPILTTILSHIPHILGGSVVVEQIFGWPGMGSLLFSAISQRDDPLVMGVTVVTALAVLGANLLLDLAYGLADPRVRYGKG